MVLRTLQAQRLRGMRLARDPARRPRPQPHIPRFPKCRSVRIAVAHVLQFCVGLILWHMLFRPVLRVVRSLWRSVTLCRLFGVPVQMHTATVFYPIGFFLWAGWNGGGRMDFWVTLLLLAVFWFSLLVHEFAHILAARCCGIGTERMVFHPFGAIALLKRGPRMGREFWIAIAGPLGSLALAGIFMFIAWKLRHHMYGLSYSGRRDPWWMYDVIRLCKTAAVLNLVVAVFNMIPIFPMDGARVLRSLLALGLSRFTRRTRGEAQITATWVVVRCVAWPLVLCLAGYILSRLFSSEDRILGFALLPELLVAALLLAAGELEYSVLCEADDDEIEDATVADH